MKIAPSHFMLSQNNPEDSKEQIYFEPDSLS